MSLTRNNPPFSAAADGTLFDWFCASAHAHPNATAIEVQGQAVSYSELLDLTRRLATALWDAADGPPRAVGLLASRSLASYVGYLAALQLSAVVVPLGPAFPAARNQLVCRSSQVDVLVVDDAGAASAAELAAGGSAAIVALRSADGGDAGRDAVGSGAVELGTHGRSWREELPEPWSEPACADLDDVVYTLFTSGSTGAPKGVPIRHRNLAAYLCYAIDHYEVGPGSRLSQTFELTFDPSVFDMFVAWCSGATLVVTQPGDILAPVGFVNDNRITHWFSVPSVVSLARRLRTLRPDCMPDLRWSLFCGEQLTLSQARSWADAAPASVVGNLYGPTELTITCTGYRLPRDQRDWPRTSNDTVPIGSVYPHLEGVLLDEDGIEADDGELCLRGPQRFGGYLDPAQDAGRFLRYDGERATITDGSPAGDDWYRTGDRVRLENGALVHLGRVDAQVKIHGYRIELGEVESVLRAHPDVEDAVVLALPDGGGELSLHAVYIGETVDQSELSQLAGGRLPSYMVPRHYVRKDRLPLNSNGKVDRRTLASEIAGDAGATLRAPATPTQEAMWWVHQRSRNQSTFNVTWRLRCGGPVDYDALAIAWQAIVERHEALRTAVVRVGGTIELAVNGRVASEPARIEVDDPGTADVSTLLRLIAEEVQGSVMTLEQAPLARLTVVRVRDTYELLLTAHHIVTDGWAHQLLIGELSTAYAAALVGQAPSFAADPVPFHVYAEEMRLAGTNGKWRRSVDYWRNKLEGAVACTLTPDRPVEPAVGAAGTILRYTFSDSAVAGVAGLGRIAAATPFATVLGALQIVLARGGAGADVTVAVVAANRMTARDQSIVGYTANLCIARGSVDDADSIADVVSRSRDGVWQMLAHQAAPFPVVFGALSEETQSTLGDAAQVMLSYLGPIASGLRLGDVDLTFLRSPNRAARADVGISFWDVEGGHVAEIEFNTARYDEATIMRLLHDLDGVLATGGIDATTRVGSLDVQTRSEARGRVTAPARTPGGVEVPAGAAVPAERPAEAAPRQLTLVEGARAADPLQGPGTPAMAPANGAPAAAAGGASEYVLAAWTDLLGAPPSGLDADFFAAGGRSLSLVQFAAELESRTGVEVDVVDWLRMPTPRRMIALLSGEDPDGARPVTTTLVRLREGTGPHLHLLHGAGGALHAYRDLIAALPPHWTVTASEERQPLRTIPMMAAHYAADLAAAGLCPDILGGWSMGGQIAYEMASAGHIPARGLVVLDAGPPVEHERDPDLDKQREAAFAAAVFQSLGVTPDGTPPRIVGGLELHMAALAAYLGCAGHTVSATVLAERWHIYRRHTEAVLTYTRSSRVDVPALIVAADLLDAQIAQWADRVGHRPRVLRVPPGHHALLSGAVCTQIAGAIESLARGLGEPLRRAANG